eukprot:scaffold35323_cov56-Attheya_sp.AAC.6
MEVQTRSARTGRASYGGVGSVRITKKPPRSRSEKKNCPVPSASMPMPIMVVANSSGCSSSEDDEDDRSIDGSKNGKPSSPSLVRLVGWDDKLCRPIYKVITSDSKKQKNNQTQPPVKDIAVVGNIEALLDNTAEDHAKPTKTSRPKKNSQRGKKARQAVQKKKSQDALETSESNVDACSFIEIFPSPAKTSRNISSNLDGLSLSGPVTKNHPSPYFETSVLNAASPVFKGRNRPKVVTTKRRQLYGSQRPKSTSEELPKRDTDTDNKEAFHKRDDDTSKQLFADSSDRQVEADALPSLPDSAPIEIEAIDEHDSFGAQQLIINDKEETYVPSVAQKQTSVTNKMDDVHDKEHEETYPCLSGDEGVDDPSEAKVHVDSEAASKSDMLSPTKNKDIMLVTESTDTREGESHLPDSLKTPVRHLHCGPIATPNFFNSAETPSSIDQHLGKGTICSPPFLQNSMSICDIPDSVTKTPRYDHEIEEERSVTLVLDTAHLDNRKIEPVAGTDQKDRARYGGKGGVWVKKKRLRYSNSRPHIPEAALSNGNHGAGIEPPSEVKRIHRTEKVDAIQGTLVGWDDNLCRPIYEHLEEESSKHGALDHVRNMCDQDDENSEIHVDTNSPGYKEPQPDELPRGKQLNQTLRAYGVRKRGRSGFSSATVTALKDFSSPKPKSDPITRRLSLKRDDSSTSKSSKKTESAATERANELPAESPNSMCI